MSDTTYEKTQHTPVLLHEAIDALQLQPGMTVVDATLGGGGYAKAIYDRIGKEGTLIAIDQDISAIERFKAHAPSYAQNITTVHSQFAHVRKILEDRGITQVHAIVADLGISSDHLEAERGFSFMHDGPLDMRMDQMRDESMTTWLARVDEAELIRVLRDYGDERYARRIARAIVTQRTERSITRTTQLVDIIKSAVPAPYRHGHKHYATRTFQALRIALNDEYSQLSIFLTSATDVITRGGRLAVVSFHSGEDKIVKRFFVAEARGCICAQELPICQCGRKPRLHIITKKGITPSQQDCARNPRARSARLRVAQKI